MLKKAISLCQICLKSIAIYVKKLGFGLLRQPLVCLHTSLPLVLELFKVRQRKHKTELKLVSSLQLHKLKTALTLPLILPFVSLISTKTTSKSSILSHCHTISHFLTSQQVPWKTGDLLPIVKFTFL